MWLLATNPGEEIPYWAIYLIGGFGLLHFLLPGVMRAWGRFWSELGGSRPIEGHFFWSKGWIRFVGLLLLGFAGYLLYANLAFTSRRPSPPRPPTAISRPTEEKDVFGAEEILPDSDN